MNPEDIPLRDLHLPAEIGAWPPAPGWWLLIAILIVGAIVLARRLLAARARHAPRRHALRALRRARRSFRSDGDVVRFAARLSELLRRTMLAYSPRAEVAGLTGEAWLDWLDRGLDAPQFRSGPGRSLIELPYRDPRTVAADVDVDSLVRAVRMRLETPPGERS